jgi:hypothetical protein
MSQRKAGLPLRNSDGTLHATFASACAETAKQVRISVGFEATADANTASVASRLTGAVALSDLEHAAVARTTRPQLRQQRSQSRKAVNGNASGR